MIKSSRRDQYIYNKIKELEASVNPEVSWGEIKGILSNQTDLQNALNSKENSLPSKTGNAGKFLKVNTTENGYQWDNAGSGGATIAQRTLTADETKVNDASVQNWFASENRLLLDANSIYEFEGTFVSLNGTTSHGLNMQFDAITGASIRWTAIGAKVNETTQATALRFTMTNTFNTNRNVTTASTVGGNVVWISGIIITGASIGYFSPKVAQTAASGSFTVKAGTYMKVRKVGTNTDTNIGGWTT